MANQAQSSGGFSGGGGGSGVTSVTGTANEIDSTGGTTPVISIDPAFKLRVTTLENNVYKVAYFASVNAASGTITIPTGATILTDQFPGGVDALVSTITSGQPTGINPVTGGGAVVDVTSFDTGGNYVLTGTPSTFPVAVIYQLSIAAKDWSNLTTANILEYEPLLGVQSVSGTANRITVTGTPQLPVINISASYVGQSSITTIGTIGTGIWQGTLINPTYGGTGVNNGAFTLTLAGNLATTGAFNTTFAAGFTGTITLPTATATLYSTQSGSITSAQLATSLTDETGTGANVFATSPTLVTPVLGTPSSGTLTSCTGLPLTSGVTGTLPITNGGTNKTTWTTNQVVYTTSTNVLGQSTGLQFDGTHLGINTTPATGSGAYAVDVVCNVLNEGPGYRMTSYANGGGNNNIFFARSANGTLASPTKSLTDDALFFFGIQGTGTGNDFRYAGDMLLECDASATATTVPGRWVFKTSSSASVLIEAMRIDSSQRVGIGLTPTAYKLEVAGDVAISVAGKKLRYKTGSNAAIGTGTLSSGTVTISTTAVTSSSFIFVTDTTTGSLVNVGSLTVGTVTNGTSFVVNSTNALDASTFNWFIVEPY